MGLTLMVGALVVLLGLLALTIWLFVSTLFDMEDPRAGTWKHDDTWTTGG